MKLNVLVACPVWYNRYYLNTFVTLFSDCTLGVSPAVLDGNIVCIIGSKCTEVDCCVQDDETMMDFNTYLRLDPCEFTLQVGIEKFNFIVPLVDFNFGMFIFSCFNMLRNLCLWSFIFKHLFFFVHYVENRMYFYYLTDQI